MAKTSVRSGAFILTAVGLLAAVLAAPAAHADIDPSDTSLPKTVTADALPTVQIDGVVWDQEIHGNTVYVAGQFTTARPAGAAAGTNTVPRANMLAYDLTTGQLISSFAPEFDAQVKTLSMSPDGTRLYAGGSFTKVTGQNRYRIAALNPQTGAVLPASSAPGTNATVNSIQATPTAVYVGGAFSTLGSATRVKVGAFVPNSTTALPFNPEIPDGNVQGVVVSPDGSKVAMGGAFTQVNGSNNPGYGLGFVDASTGRTNLPFSANAAIRNGGTESAILSLKADEDGFYGSGYHFGGGGNLEGSFQATWDGDLAWVEDCHGDTYDIAPAGDVIYAASHKHYCDNLGTGGFPQTEPNWSFQHGTAYTKYATGVSRKDIYGYGDHPGRPSPTLLNFFPDFVPGSYTGKNQGPWDVETDGDYVVYGGEFTRVNNQPQQGIVRFARQGIAPEKQGPRQSAAALGVKARTVGDGTVRVSWPGTFDRDNATLTYAVYRDTAGNKVWEGQQTARFWEVQPMGFTDTGLTPGSSVRYRLRVSDSSGNYADSDWVTTTVDSTGSLGAYGAEVLSDGASKFWRLSETTRAATDSAGVDDTTVGTGATRGTAGALQDGSGNAATTFNGTNSSVTVSPTLLWAPQAFSMETWFRTSATGKIAGFGNRASGDSSNYDRHLYVDSNGRLNFGVYDGTNSQLVTNATSVRDNQWHHAVGTFEKGTMALYVDGRRVGVRSGVSGAQRYWGYWRVGGDTSWSGNKYFNGAIDDFAIYPKALTAAQVDSHWTASGRSSTVPQAPSDNYGKAVYNAEPELYWRLSESSGTTAQDSSVNGTTGALLGNFVLNQAGAISGNAALRVQRPVPGGILGAGAKAGGNVVSSRAYANPQVFTQQVWIKTTATDGGRIFGFGSSSNGSASTNYDRQLYMLDNGRVRFGVNPGTPITIDSSSPLNDGAWHQIVSSVGPDGMKLYVDGVLNASDANTVSQNYTGYWKIGGDNTWGGNAQSYFLGEVDEAAVYPRQLSAATVRAQYIASGRSVSNTPPTAAFTALPNGATVAFDSSASTDPEGPIASYAWNFGDGGTSTAANPSHVYTASGTYAVTLQVTDADGATATVSHLVPVTVPNAGPTAGFTHAVDGLDVAFTSTSTDADGSVASYAWNFGDGTTSTEQNPTHTYADGAVRTVTLTVTDNDGATDTTSTSVDPEAAPVADFSAAKRGLTVDFTSTSTDDDQIATHAWQFGDGATSTQADPTHAYDEAGDYAVRLTVTDRAGRTHAVTKTVSVVAPAPGGTVARDQFARSVTGGWGSADLGGAWRVASGPAAFTVNGSAGLVSLPPGGGRDVTLEGSSSRETDLTFDYTLQQKATGGGTFLDTYVRSVDGVGSYRAKLVARSDGRMRLDLVRVVGGTTTTLGSVIVPGLTLAGGDTVKVRAQAVGAGSTDLKVKVWKAGTTEPGTWTLERSDATAQLQTSGRIGFTFYVSGSTTGSQVYVIDDLTAATPGPQAPNANPTANFTSSVSGTTASFNASSSGDSDGTIVSYAWNFGDTRTGTGVSPTHAYTQDGTYQVTLTVMDDDGAIATVAKSVTVQAPAPGGDAARDTFDRTVTGGWGTADQGGAWTPASGAAAFSVSGSAGRVTLPAGGAREIMLTGSAARETNLTFDYTTEKSGTGGGTFLEPFVRAVDASTSYRAKVVSRSDGQVRVDLVRVAGGTTTTLGSRLVPSLTVAGGETMKVRIQAVGASATDLRIKVWKAGSAEPSAWSLERQDTTAALQAPGRIGLGFYVSSSTTSVPQVYVIDDLRATTP
jgi:PKD repeat protein/uncharacterized protein YcfJ